MKIARNNFLPSRSSVNGSFLAAAAATATADSGVTLHQLPRRGGESVETRIVGAFRKTGGNRATMRSPRRSLHRERKTEESRRKKSEREHGDRWKERGRVGEEEVAERAGGCSASLFRFPPLSFIYRPA